MIWLNTQSLEYNLHFAAISAFDALLNNGDQNHNRSIETNAIFK